MKIPVFSQLYSTLLKHPKYRWVVMGASLLYLLSPLDVSPDLVPIIGWVDDGVVAALLATGITQVLLERRQALRERQTVTTAGDPALDVAARPADTEPS